jgi:hypothetical protein
MGHSELDRETFCQAREWRKARASLAAYARHGNSAQAQRIREILPLMRQPAALRAVTQVEPGIFEFGSPHAELFYRMVDLWGSILAPGAFIRPEAGQP